MGNNKDSTSNPTIKGRTIDVEFQFKMFSFYFRLNLAALILKHTDNFSKPLLSTSMSATDGAHTAAMTVKTLQSIGNSECYDAFLDLVLRDHQEVDVDNHRLPWKRTVPRWLDKGSAPANSQQTAKLISTKVCMPVSLPIVLPITRSFWTPVSLTENRAGRFVAAVSSPPFCCGYTSSPAISSRGHFVASHFVACRFVAGTLRRLPFRRGDASSLEHKDVEFTWAQRQRDEQCANCTYTLYMLG